GGEGVLAKVRRCWRRWTQMQRQEAILPPRAELPRRHMSRGSPPRTNKAVQRALQAPSPSGSHGGVTLHCGESSFLVRHIHLPSLLCSLSLSLSMSLSV
ncbi:unnamed protein product, partial [Musa acuminata var. zebrina]